jgi:hypothetical protein
MPADPDRFIRHIHACNNAKLPGSRVRLHLGSAPIGWVEPAHAPPEPLANQAAFAAYADRLHRQGAFRPRDELFDVRDETTGAVIATVDRGAIPLLGIAAEGVHLNGLVQRPDGLHLWVGRRAPDKRLDPGKLDHITAGGIAAGHDCWSTLLKEGEEEASLPPALCRQATPAGRLRYAMLGQAGLRRDRLHCFDLLLPASFTPRPNDNEVASFTLWPLHEVMQRVADTDDFKFNVNLVLIDLFLRTGLIDPASPSGQRIDQAMQQVRAA